MTVTHGLYDSRLLRVMIAGLAYAGIVGVLTFVIFTPGSALLQGVIAGLAAWCGGALVIALGLGRAAAMEPYGEEVAASDPLTGLPDERSFRVEATRLLEDAPEGKVAIVLFETEGVSAINSRCGRRAGDELIRAAAATVETAADGLGQPSHLGGGRFAVIVDQEDASRTFQVLRLVQPAATAIEACGHTHALQLPAGFASSKAGENLGSLLARAEQRLQATRRRESGGPNTGIARAS